MRPATKLTFDEIMNVVSAYYELAAEDLTGPRRTREMAIARQVVMYLARELTDMSLPQVGQALGGRDHTTVMHGCDKMAALFEKDDDVRRQILEIKSQLYGNGQKMAVSQASHRG